MKGYTHAEVGAERSADEAAPAVQCTGETITNTKLQLQTNRGCQGRRRRNSNE